MRTALWETSSGALAALLNSRVPLEKADIYTITLQGGTALRWSGHDLAITGGGHTYELGPGIRRGRLRFVAGVEVDTLQMTLFTDASRPVTIGGTPLLQYIRQGGLYGARVQLDRVFRGVSDTGPVGALAWFSGRVADVQVNRQQAQLAVKSDLELLNVMVPRDVYQPGCLNTLYDGACGLARSAWEATGSATGATDAARLTFPHAMPQADGYFDLGVIQFTSGANAGAVRTVKRQASGQLSVMQPWPAAVANGDAFKAWPGCNKTVTTCGGKFSNLLRFRGQPHIPKPDTIA